MTTPASSILCRIVSKFLKCCSMSVSRDDRSSMKDNKIFDSNPANTLVINLVNVRYDSFIIHVPFYFSNPIQSILIYVPIFTVRKKCCLCRDSNPDLPCGRREFYHLTTTAHTTRSAHCHNYSLFTSFPFTHSLLIHFFSFPMTTLTILSFCYTYTTIYFYWNVFFFSDMPGCFFLFFFSFLLR